MNSLIESFWMKIFEIILAMIFTIMGVGCISPPDDATVKDQIEAQAATFEQTVKAIADAGVKGTIYMDLSMTGEVGMFNGFRWNLGPKIMAFLELDPESARKLEAILNANKDKVGVNKEAENP